MSEIQNLHNWLSGDLITAERLNIVNDNITSTQEDIKEKFKINSENSIENIPNYISNIESNLRQDFSTDLNNINQVLSENIINLFDSIKKLKLNEDANENIEIDFEDPTISQNTQVIAEGASTILVLNQMINKLLEKIDNKFTEMDNLLHTYDVNQTTMINSLPFPKMGDIYISTVDYEIEKENEKNPLKPATGQCRCNYLTILPALQSGQEGIYWIPYGQGRTLIGAGSGTDSRNETRSFSGGAVGGEYKHLLITNEMPAHNHSYTRREVNTEVKAAAGKKKKNVTTLTTSNQSTSSVGNNQAHNNLPPYIVVYFYKRVTADEFQQYYNLDSNFYLIQDTEPGSIIE